MNYQWHYDQLVETRKKRKREVGKYYERHHILPVSLGGNNEDGNLVYLTAREHFIAHWLLWRIYRNRSMAMAFFGMCKYSSSNQKRIYISGRMYNEAKEARSLLGNSIETRKKCSDSRIAHEIRWQMTLPKEEAEKRIQEYHNRLSNGVKKYHRDRDHSKSRFSDEARQRMNKHKLGVALTDEHKEKLRIKSQRKGRKLNLVECPYCKKTGKGGNMTRYHFNNCKFKKDDNTGS